MSEKAKEKVGEKNIQAQIPAEYRLEKDYSQVTKLLPEMRKQAIEQRVWTEIELWRNRGYLLEISISPDGNPMLRIVSPSLKNSFVIANADIFHFLLDLAKTLELNKDTIMNIIGLCNKYNERQRKTSKRIIV